ncbi:MAG: protoporphyrinogen oxidase HemJ [Pseudomonadota bacterium]
MPTGFLQSPAGRAGLVLAATVVFALVLMLGLGDDAYLWIKSIHIVAVISWMAGMLYLPRLFVYHAEAGPGSETAATLKVMEQRLLHIIMTPAMIVSWGLGLWLAWQVDALASGWFHLKLLAVIGLSAAHGYLAASVRRFATDSESNSSRHWRIVNEVPTVLMIVAVIAVVVKPF